MILGSGLALSASFAVIASMSFCAASTPSIWFSVSTICFSAGAACGAGVVCFGACLACASASPAHAVAIEAARQATPSAAAIGRTNSRMEVSQGLDGFRSGQARPDDGQTTIERIWRQIMAETNQDGRASKQRKLPDKKTPPPRGEAAFCSIMTRKEELPCPWQAWQRPTLPGLKP